MRLCRHSTRAPWFAVIAVCLGSVGCGSQFSAGGPGAGDASGGDDANDGGVIILGDAGPSDSATADAASSDSSTLDGAKSDGGGCPTGPGSGVFVAPGGATTSCGALGAPCGTVAAGIAAAMQSGGPTHIVYVAGSASPYVEQVTLAAGITIQGGWVYTGAGQWSRPCNPSASATTIQAPPGADRVVIADYSGASTLDTLTVSNVTVAASGTASSPGQTLYGIFASNSQAGHTTLALHDVDIQVAAGGSGGTGTQGMAGSAAALASSGCATSGGTSPGPGALGSAATTGSYDVAGYHPQPGGTGTQGVSGQDGTAAPAITAGANCISAYTGLVAGGYNTDVNCGAVPNACVNITSSKVLACGTVGSNGCGGGGSYGGSAGSGGGGSIGIFVWNETVTLDTAAVTTSKGGKGGNGGPGGAVPAGSPGAAGNPGPNVYSSCSVVGPSTCLPSGSPS